MTQLTEKSTKDTYKRLWPYIKVYKAGIIVAVIALIINAAGDTLMLSMIKPLLDKSLMI